MRVVCLSERRASLQTPCSQGMPLAAGRGGEREREREKEREKERERERERQTRERERERKTRKRERERERENGGHKARVNTVCRRLRSRCKDCGGTSIYEHNRQRGQCSLWDACCRVPQRASDLCVYVLPLQ